MCLNYLIILHRYKYEIVFWNLCESVILIVTIKLKMVQHLWQLNAFLVALDNDIATIRVQKSFNSNAGKKSIDLRYRQAGRRDVTQLRFL